MGVRDQTCDCTENCEGLNLEMSGRGEDLGLVKRDVRVVLLVHIEVLDKTLAEEIIEAQLVLSEGLGKKRDRISYSPEADRLQTLPLTCMCSLRTLLLPSSTMIMGRQIRPPSEAMWTAF